MLHTLTFVFAYQVLWFANISDTNKPMNITNFKAIYYHLILNMHTFFLALKRIDTFELKLVKTLSIGWF